MKPHLEVVAAIICNNKNEVLFAQKLRTAKNSANLWEFPGGKVDDGESHEQALCREILEELNLSIEINKHFISNTHEYPFAVIHLHSYLAISKSDMFENREHQKVIWLQKEKAQNFIFAPADIPVYEKLLRNYSASSTTKA